MIVTKVEHVFGIVIVYLRFMHSPTLFQNISKILVSHPVIVIHNTSLIISNDPLFNPTVIVCCCKQPILWIWNLIL